MQVAAYADHHLCVRKAVDSEGRVHTSVDALLDINDRAHEVAAMLGELSNMLHVVKQTSNLVLTKLNKWFESLCGSHCCIRLSFGDCLLVLLLLGSCIQPSHTEKCSAALYLPDAPCSPHSSMPCSLNWPLCPLQICIYSHHTCCVNTKPEPRTHSYRSMCYAFKSQGCICHQDLCAARCMYQDPLWLHRVRPQPSNADARRSEEAICVTDSLTLNDVK